MNQPEQLVKLGFLSRPSRLKLVRCIVRDTADMAGLGIEQVDQVVLAVNEACMNVIQHAYAMDPDGSIEVEMLSDGLALTIRIRDNAPRVDKTAIRSRNLDDIRPGGLGMHMIKTLMDEYSFLDQESGAGNLLEMKKYISSGSDVDAVSG